MARASGEDHLIRGTITAQEAILPNHSVGASRGLHEVFPGSEIDPLEGVSTHSFVAVSVGVEALRT